MNQVKTLILLFIFIAIGGLVLYDNRSENNFSPIDYATRR